MRDPTQQSQPQQDDDVPLGGSAHSLSGQAILTGTGGAPYSGIFGVTVPANSLRVIDAGRDNYITTGGGHASHHPGKQASDGGRGVAVVGAGQSRYLTGSGLGGDLNESMSGGGVVGVHRMAGDLRITGGHSNGSVAGVNQLTGGGLSTGVPGFPMTGGRRSGDVTGGTSGPGGRSPTYETQDVYPVISKNTAPPMRSSTAPPIRLSSTATVAQRRRSGDGQVAAPIATSEELSPSPTTVYRPSLPLVSVSSSDERFLVIDHKYPTYGRRGRDGVKARAADAPTQTKVIDPPQLSSGSHRQNRSSSAQRSDWPSKPELPSHGNGVKIKPTAFVGSAAGLHPCYTNYSHSPEVRRPRPDRRFTGGDSLVDRRFPGGGGGDNLAVAGLVDAVPGSVRRPASFAHALETSNRLNVEPRYGSRDRLQPHSEEEGGGDRSMQQSVLEISV